MVRICILLVVGLWVFTPKSIIAQQEPRRSVSAPETGEKFQLGIAGFTFLKFDIDKSLETMQRLDIHYLCIKDFHLPLNSTAEQIKAFHDKLKLKGVTGYAVGPIYMKSEADVDQAFDYAQRVGVKLIIGIPGYELLPYVEKKVKEYGFRFAIHLHGPDIAIFPDAADVWNHIRNLDPKIGMCLDIGHDTRNGKDPVKYL